MIKSLDQKLEALRADPSGCTDFILCDAKDSDMAFGAVSSGEYNSLERPEANFPYRSRDEFIDQTRAIIKQAHVDIMLMSASIAEKLVIDERLFEDSPLTPAVRANDTTDIHAVRGGIYPRVASRPFRSATIDQLQCGKVRCTDLERAQGTDLGLYSVTFNNNLERDLATLEAYKAFRLEAEASGFRHFLEVFAPNAPEAIDPAELGHFINDHVIRTLAAVPRASRPVFLKVAYLGGRFIEELVHYDPTMIVGVMGGAAGTSFDAFNLLHQAKRHGARAALFGRKINNAEHQPAFVKLLRLVADGEVDPGEAVRAYHGVLQKLGIRPRRALNEDLIPGVDLYAGDEASAVSVVVPEHPWRAGENSKAGFPGAEVHGKTSEPDFDTMTAEQKLAYNQRRRDHIFG